MAEITPDKLELLRVALPKGLTAGDSGLGEFSGKQTMQTSWPQFQASSTETKLYTGSPAISEEIGQIASQQQLFEPHPWKIYTKKEDEQTLYKVEYNSKLYSSLENWNNIAITGLDFWTEIFNGYVVLSGTVENGECTEAEKAESTDELPDRISFSNENQTGFTFVIGYLYQDENGKWIILQQAFQDLTLANFCINGKPAIYPI